MPLIEGAPSISGISQNPVPGIYGDKVITIYGSNIVSGATVTLNDLTYGGGPYTKPTTFYSSGQLTISANVTVENATWSAQVTNPDGTTSNVYQFTTQIPAGGSPPSISGISPNPVPGIYGDQVITIYGNNFVSGATVTLNDLTYGGGPYMKPTTFYSSGQLTISANVTVENATWSAQVTNPDGTTSNVYQFTTQIPAGGSPPSISGISPNPVPGIYGDQVITIYGNNFVSGATVTLNDLTYGGGPYMKPTTFYSSGQLTISANVTVENATWSAQVTNPDGTTSNVYQFTTQIPAGGSPPSISGISPNPVPGIYGDQVITIYGSNFVSGATVTLNDLTYGGGPYTKPTTFYSSGQLTISANVTVENATWSAQVTNPDGTTSNVYQFTTQIPAGGSPPSISGISPNPVPGIYGDQVITIYGNNFVSGATVTLNDLTYGGGPYMKPTTFYSSGQLTISANVTVENATWSAQVTNPDGTTSNVYQFTTQIPAGGSPPSISGISPNPVPGIYGDQVITIYGSNFVSGATVTLNDLTYGGGPYTKPTTFYSSGQLTISANVTVENATWSAQVTNPDGTTSNVYQFTTQIPAGGSPPSISGISPNPVPGIYGDQVITIYGSNFVSGATVTLNDLTYGGGPYTKPTTFYSSGQLTISANVTVENATWSAQVTNPDGTTSNVYQFTTQIPAGGSPPSISGISPNPVPGIYGDQVITIYGSNFVSGATVTLNDLTYGGGPYMKPTTFYSSGQLTISANVTVENATWSAQVTNPDGTTSNVYQFTTQIPAGGSPPSISGISPNPVPGIYGDQVITIYGSNFVSGATVTLNDLTYGGGPYTKPTTFYSSGQLTISANVTVENATWSAQVTNPDGTTSNVYQFTTQIPAGGSPPSISGISPNPVPGIYGDQVITIYGSNFVSGATVTLNDLTYGGGPYTKPTTFYSSGQLTISANVTVENATWSAQVTNPDGTTSNVYQFTTQIPAGGSPPSISGISPNPVPGIYGDQVITIYGNNFVSGATVTLNDLTYGGGPYMKPTTFYSSGQLTISANVTVENATWSAQVTNPDGTTSNVYQFTTQIPAGGSPPSISGISPNPVPGIYGDQVITIYGSNFVSGATVTLNDLTYGGGPYTKPTTFYSSGQLTISANVTVENATWSAQVTNPDGTTSNVYQFTTQIPAGGSPPSISGISPNPVPGIYGDQVITIYGSNFVSGATVTLNDLTYGGGPYMKPTTFYSSGQLTISANVTVENATWSAQVTNPDGTTSNVYQFTTQIPAGGSPPSISGISPNPVPGIYGDQVITIYGSNFVSGATVTLNDLTYGGGPYTKPTTFYSSGQLTISANVTVENATWSAQVTNPDGTTSNVYQFTTQIPAGGSPPSISGISPNPVPGIYGDQVITIYGSNFVSGATVTLNDLTYGGGPYTKPTTFYSSGQLTISANVTVENATWSAQVTNPDGTTSNVYQFTTQIPAGGSPPSISGISPNPVPGIYGDQVITIYGNNFVSGATVTLNDLTYGGGPYMKPTTFYSSGQLTISANVTVENATWSAQVTNPDGTTSNVYQFTTQIPAGGSPPSISGISPNPVPGIYGDQVITIYGSNFVSGATVTLNDLTYGGGPYTKPTTFYSSGQLTISANVTVENATWSAQVTNPDGTTSNVYQFTTQIPAGGSPPSISGISPNPVPGIYGDQVITIYGSNFVSGATVTLNDLTYGGGPYTKPTTFYSSGQLTISANVTVENATWSAQVTNPDGTTSNVYQFTTQIPAGGSPPSISGISPNPVPGIYGDQVITIYGNNFVSGATVTLNDLTYGGGPYMKPTTFYSSGQLTISANVTVENATWSAQVTNPDGTTSNVYQFTTQIPAGGSPPSISGISPNPVPGIYGDQVITIYGSNFVSGATVTLNDLTYGGGPYTKPTTFYSSGQLTISANVTVENATWSAQVTNPDGTTSNVYQFTTQIPAGGSPPSISGISPNPVPGIYGDQVITIYGNNFVSGATVTLNDLTYGGGPYMKPTTFYSSGQLTISANVTVENATWSAQVTNPDGTTSNVYQFTTQIPAGGSPPSISGISPNPVPGIYGDQVITIYGSNFVSGATVTLNDLTYGGGPYTKPTTFYSSGQLTISANVTVENATWSAQVTNPDGTTSNVYQFTTQIPAGGSPPSISGISPNPVPGIYGDQVITIYGNNFVSGATVTLNDLTYGGGPYMKPTTFYSSGQLTISANVTVENATWSAQVTNPDGTTSNVYQFTTQIPAGGSPPSISGISPNPVPGIYGDQVITIYGSNFVSGATVTLNDLTYGGGPYTKPTTFYSSGQLTISANVTVENATWSAQVTNPDGTTSNVYQFTTQIPAGGSPPSISGISPNPVPGIYGDQVITIYGNNFVSGATVTLNDLTYGGGPYMKPTTFYSSGQLTISANVTVENATWSAQVTNPDGTTSNVYQFTTQIPAGGSPPSISGISPNPVPRTYVDHVSTFYSSGQLTISANVTVENATWSAQVTNPDGTTSNVYQFTTQIPAGGSPPSISGISPNPVPGIYGDQVITIYGCNFVSGATVTLNDLTYGGGPYTKPTTFYSSGQLTISANVTVENATWSAQVTNPDGTTSNVYQFTTQIPAGGSPPSISGISPNPVPGIYGDQVITIYGCNFVSGATVTLNDLTYGGG